MNHKQGHRNAKLKGQLRHATTGRCSLSIRLFLVTFQTKSHGAMTLRLSGCFTDLQQTQTQLSTTSHFYHKHMFRF